MKQKKRLFSLILLGLCITACAGLCFACGSKEEEIPMGRYAEREIEIPGGYDYMHPLADGGCYLYGDGAGILQITAEGEQNQKAWGWRKTANINVEMAYGVSDAGEVIFSYYPKWSTNEEYEEYEKDGGLMHYEYLYVDEKGTKHPLKLFGEDYQAMTNFEYYAFAQDGSLYGAGETSGVYRIDVETGRTDCLFETENPVNEFAFVGDIMLALDTEKAYLYDMAGGKLLDGNTILNEFVSSHQTGTKSIVLAATERIEITDTQEMTEMSDMGSTETGDRSPILYLACRTGLYRYVWGGSVIEQIADGQLLTLGNSQYKPLALQVLPDEQFRILFSGNRMLEFYYDETIPSRPEKELVVYSLQEDGRIRYAAQLFGQQNPDVLVTYETGMEGDNAVTKEDALKNLNTRILAGEGPDILLLDGMDIEQYAEKGVLRELDDFLAPYEEEGVLYQNIAEAMRMTEKEKIYSIPLTIHLPIRTSDEKYLGGEESLEDIVAGIELARKEHPEGPLLFAPKEEDLLRQLIPICLPAWTMSEQTGGGSSLNVEKIEEFYQAAERLWELEISGMSAEEHQAWQENFEDWSENNMWVFMMVPYLPLDNGQECWATISYMRDAFAGMVEYHTMYYNIARFGIKEVDELAIETCHGQAQNVFWAESIVGICEQTEEDELAETFMELLLSEQIMDKWWLNKGIPIRRDSLAASLDITNKEYGQVMGYSETDFYYAYNELIWPTEEEKQWLYQMMEEADCCYLSGTMLEETVKEVGMQVLSGSMTPEEGAKEVAGRMEIEMQE